MVWLGGFSQLLEQDPPFNRGFPVFVAPVRESFGASNAAVAFIFRAGACPKWTDGPLAGWCLDRWGPRRVLWVGRS